MRRTKHAIEGYSESLDHELRTFGVRVVLVEPAYTQTSFGENLARPDRLLDTYNSDCISVYGLPMMCRWAERVPAHII